MSYTPPDGFVLDEYVGDYIVTRIATVYSYNYGINYYNKTNTVNGGTGTIEREFRYRKKDIPNIYNKYYVEITIYFSTIHCKCNKVTDIPGTNSGNVRLGIIVDLNCEIGEGIGGHTETISFSWVMKDGIDQNKYFKGPCNYCLGSRFTTQESWVINNADGSKTFYDFYININTDSINSPSHS